MPSFYNGKRFFLTYPRCELSVNEVAAKFMFIAPLKYYLVAQEEHQDGGKHIHACIEFESVQRHGARWLDLDGHHPNKQDPRNWNACKEYCKKDKNFIESEKSEKKSILEKCEEFGDEKLWMEYCVENKIQFQFAQWFWNRTHNDDCTITGDEHEGVVKPNLAQLVFNPEIHRTLVIKGRSGIGKTTWAKRVMPKPCLFVSHIDQLKKFRVGFHKSIIFDDVDFNHFPRVAQIHLVDFDNPRAIHCRHNVAQIPAGIYKVFTCNEWPLGEDPAVMRRIKRINVA
jgi:hypothetical protein